MEEELHVLTHLFVLTAQRNCCENACHNIFPEKFWCFSRLGFGHGERAAKEVENIRGWIPNMWLLFLFLSAALGRFHLYIDVLCIFCSASTNIIPGALAVLIQLYHDKAVYGKMTFSSWRRRCCLRDNTVIVSMKWLVLGGGEFL